MMSHYKAITLDKYNIQKRECKCNKCEKVFEEYEPQDYELVCFEDVEGKRYFLPTYGEYGYLDLLGKLITDWKPSDKITKLVSERFIEKLNEFTQINVVLTQNTKCPACHSQDVFVNKRLTIADYPIQWLELDTNKIICFVKKALS